MPWLPHPSMYISSVASALHLPMYNAHREVPDANVRCCLHGMKPLWSFSQTVGRPFTGRWGGIIIREEEHWFTAFLCLYTEFKAASVKLMSQPSIKEALTSLNYRWSKITYAGLFEGNNVSGRQSHVIFSMLPERGLNISRPHLRLFLTSTAYKMT